LDIVQGVGAAGTRGGDAQRGLAPCSLLPLETQDLGLRLDISINSSAKVSGCGLISSSSVLSSSLCPDILADGSGSAPQWIGGERNAG